METVEGLLGALRVAEPELRVEHLGTGPAVLPVGERWALVAVARGDVSALDTVLGPGDALLTRGRGTLAARGLEEGTTVLVARFALHGAGQRLLRLPDDVVVPADSELCRLLIARLTDDPAESASDVVSGRLLDWLVAATVRDVLAAGPPNGPSGTVHDPAVAAALAAVHADPAGSWTVARLADHAGVGRAAFARRFREAVGSAPLSYVREHRLDLAEQALLTEPDATIAAVARRVGYATPFSFSAAFRRHRGIAPSELRASHRQRSADVPITDSSWSFS